MSVERPSDFDAFWTRVKEELGSLPIAPEEEHLPLRSTRFADEYAVRLTSLGRYRIFGYLSIPKGEGPFPALVYLSRCQSVVEIIPQGDSNEKRKQFIVFSVAARGQRNSDRPYAASFPGMFVDGIEDPATYIFRGIVADCCRAVDYVMTRPEVDSSQICALIGNDLPLLTAAIRSEVTHLVATPGFLHNTLDRCGQTGEYPHEEINELLRADPGLRDPIANTMAYYDPACFADAIRASALLWGDAGSLDPLVQQLNGPTEVRPSEYSRYKDGLGEATWISTQFGLDEVVVPAPWR